METRTFEDILELCKELAKHTRATGHNVLPSDEPPYLAYRAFARKESGESDQSTEVTFRIEVTKVGPSLNKHADGPLAEQADLIKRALATGEGRIRLAMAFPGQEIDRG
jgi:hypothetical protein